MSSLYLDSSALVKLVRHEKASEALKLWLAEQTQSTEDVSLVSSALSLTEVMRTARKWGGEVPELAHELLATLTVLPVSQVVLRFAAIVPPTSLRSLDAIHLATAMSLGSRLKAFISYDNQLQEAARDVGLPVEAPS